MIVEKKNKKQLNRPEEGVHVCLRRSIVDLLSLGSCGSLSKSVAFGFFKFVASEAVHEVCLFFRLRCAEPKFSQVRCKPCGHALSMACQLSVGWACRWLVSAVFWSWIEKSSDFPDRFRNEKWNARAHSIRTPAILRVRGVIVCMPYLPLQKVRLRNSICVSSLGQWNWLPAVTSCNSMKFDDRFSNSQTCSSRLNFNFVYVCNTLLFCANKWSKGEGKGKAEEGKGEREKRKGNWKL